MKLLMVLLRAIDETDMKYCFTLETEKKLPKVKNR
jgi:hypothetical protein